MVPYVGALRPLFIAVARVLTGGGLFAFTCEEHDGEDFQLGETLRFRHAPAFVAAEAEAAGFGLLASEPAVLRMDGGAPVAGLVTLLARPADIVPLNPRPSGGGILGRAA